MLQLLSVGVLTLLVGDAAAGLASGLARGLALAAAAVLRAVAKALSGKSSDMFHFYNLLVIDLHYYTYYITQKARSQQYRLKKFENNLHRG